MFAIAGIVLLLIQAAARPGELAVASLPVPLVGLSIALGLFGLAIDYKLRKSQLIVAPQLAWALALAAWTLATTPRELALGFALFLLLAHGVQRFRMLGVVAATILGGVVCVAALALRRGLDDPRDALVALAVAAPLAVALFERKRSLTRGFLLLLTLALAGLCVDLTQSRAAQLVLAIVVVVHFATRYGTRGLVAGAVVVALVVQLGHGAFVRPTLHDPIALVLAGALIFVSLRILAGVRRLYADDSAAAVARTWAQALQASLAGVAAAVLLFPAVDPALLWIYSGLAGALYQATRAHDPKLRVGILGAACL
jgi:hypothetical protein